jgi:hypothetical protein
MRDHNGNPPDVASLIRATSLDLVLRDARNGALLGMRSEDGLAGGRVSVSVTRHEEHNMAIDGVGYAFG